MDDLGVALLKQPPFIDSQWLSMMVNQLVRERDSCTLKGWRFFYEWLVIIGSLAAMGQAVHQRMGDMFTNNNSWNTRLNDSTPGVQGPLTHSQLDNEWPKVIQWWQKNRPIAERQQRVTRAHPCWDHDRVYPGGSKWLMSLQRVYQLAHDFGVSQDNSNDVALQRQLII